MSHVPLEGLGVFLGESNRDKTSSYLLGAGTMGLLAGFGLGSKQPNKLMLLTGAAMLAYGNYLGGLIDFKPAPGVSRTVQNLRDRAPSMPWRRPAVPSPKATFTLF